MTWCGCGQETSTCVACTAGHDCPTPVCAECAQKALDEAAAVERALRDVGMRDRLWNIWHRLTWALGRRGRSVRRTTDRRRDQKEVA